MKRFYISFGIITLVLGMMLAMQFKTNSTRDQGISSDRVQEIQLEVSKLERDSLKLDEEIADLEAKLEQANKGQLGAKQAILDELTKRRIGAGLVSLTGPGAEITLDNPVVPSRNFISIIRDEDLLRLANELKGAGAEAIAINNQRLISISEIRLSGSFININLERINPPFKIVAIGNPEKLKSALEISGGLLDYFRDLGMAVEIHTPDKVTVPAYNKDLNYNFAEAVRKDD